MPAPFFWRDKAWSLTEALPQNFVLSETVADLDILFPSMGLTTGWYTFRAQVSFVRYDTSETKAHSQLGALGLVESPYNWEGTIDSNEFQVFISPGLGAQFQVEVLDLNAIPLPQVPVRVFKASDIPDGLAFENIWTDVEPILSGTTDFSQGLVKIWQGAPCVGQNDYLLVAYYQGDYKAVNLNEADPGWASECGGVVDTQITFGDNIPEFPLLSTFSVLARNSVWIQAGAVIESGHVGVMDVSPGLWLDSGVEVSVGLNARTTDGVHTYGDSVKLWWGASVEDLYYNHLQNEGEIRGEDVTPLSLPLPVSFPPFPDITPGTKDVNVRIWRTTTLNPGNYRDVSVGILGTLNLKAGLYQFRNLNLGARSKLVCLGPGPTEIRIKQRMYPGWRATIGPTSQSGLSAKDVTFYIEGTNGNLWNLFAYPRAAEIGMQNEVKANMVVPNGTISIDAGSEVQGSFIAQGIVVGANVQVDLHSSF